MLQTNGNRHRRAQTLSAGGGLKRSELKIFKIHLLCKLACNSTKVKNLHNIHYIYNNISYNLTLRINLCPLNNKYVSNIYV